jgi:hypothetical protein
MQEPVKTNQHCSQLPKRMIKHMEEGKQECSNQLKTFFTHLSAIRTFCPTLEISAIL